MRSFLFGAVATLVLSFAVPSVAAPLATSCPREYAGAVAPDLQNEKLSGRLREFCYSQFGVYHSGITATPLFVGQRLTADLVKRAKLVDRTDVFRPELRLPEAERAELGHYRGSGLDRGHMAPAADMASDRANDDSFSLANMVPQYPQLNRTYWAVIEETTRALALRYGEVFVVTGPAFVGDLSRIGGRVIVPSAVFKAVYIPTTGQSSVWWAENSDAGVMEVVSVDTLAARIGADVFPSVSAESKGRIVSLPMPKGVVARSGDVMQIDNVGLDRGTTASTGQSWWGSAGALLMDVLEIVVTKLLRG